MMCIVLIQKKINSKSIIKGMSIIQEYEEGGFVYYLINNGHEYLFVQTSHSMSITEIQTELSISSSILNLKCSYSIEDFNKLYFVNFSDSIMFEKSFNLMSYNDFRLFFMDDSPEDPSLLNQYVVAQKAFASNFHHLFDVNKPSYIPLNSYYLSLYEEDDNYIFILIGNINNDLEYIVNTYGFHESFLSIYFNSSDTIKLDFCTEYLNDFLFSTKATDYYCFQLFNNSDELNKVLNTYTRKRKITTILKE